MANLQEVVSWEAGIYQLETGDPVLGGPGGISNKQAQALANRTAYLKKHVDDIEGGNTAAGKADKLSTARLIALAGDVTGQAAFDGSGNITITATYKNSGVVAGTYRSVTVDAKGNITAGTNPTTLAGYGITDALPANGTAAAAQKLATARTIALAGDVTGQANFDGSGNISITATYKNSGVTAGTYRSVTVDAKGNITGGTNPTTLAGYGITDAVPNTQKGAANGVATLDSNTKIPAGQLPQATNAEIGGVRFATQAEALAGVLNSVAVAPKEMQVAIEAILDVVAPIGVVLPWVKDTPPNDRFIMVKNQTFNKAALPKLAAIFPSGQIPFDPRGLALRFWDGGRGRDPGRVLLSEQGDAIRNITGGFTTDNGWMFTQGAGAMRVSGDPTPNTKNATMAGTASVWAHVNFDASRIVPTADENRMANWAPSAIMRVK
ncbi:hypothetical protein ACK35S_16585 [Aeromonas veronii]